MSRLVNLSLHRTQLMWLLICVMLWCPNHHRVCCAPLP
jgi:hypothetical protein